MKSRIDFTEGVAVNQVVPLELLRVGEIGHVVSVQGADRIVARLAENGLREGCRLEVLTTGESIVCRVDETKLSMRTDGAVDVLVELLGQAIP